jgi:hypothetical protein
MGSIFSCDSIGFTLTCLDLCTDGVKGDYEKLTGLLQGNGHGAIVIVNGVKQALACIITDRFAVHMNFPPIK